MAGKHGENTKIDVMQRHQLRIVSSFVWILYRTFKEIFDLIS
jgi:hypothetical protein